MVQKGPDVAKKEEIFVGHDKFVKKINVPAQIKLWPI